MDKGRRGKTENFRAPLSPEALHFIELASQQQRDGHIFPGVKGGVISDASMARLMEQEGLRQGHMAFAQRCLCGGQKANRQAAKWLRQSSRIKLDHLRNLPTTALTTSSKEES